MKMPTMQVTFADLLSQETKSNPIPLFARWREEAPLAHVPDPDGTGTMWIALNHDDAVAILSDPRFTKDRQKLAPPLAETGLPPDRSLSAALTWRRDMLRLDPPDHTRLRGLLSKAFTPQAIERLRPSIQQTADRLLDAVAEQRRMDLIRDFAFPLPLAVLCELLGIAEAERPEFTVLARRLLTESDGAQDTAPLLETLLQCIKSLLAQKKAHPGSDLTSALVQAAEGEAAALSEIELISTIWLLIYAGYETTVNLIGNGVLMLLQHPEQLQFLRREPARLPAAVEEILRCAPPLLLTTPRWAIEDLYLHGHLIRRGERVFVALIAAGADPREISAPQRFDIARQECRHLAFGRGIHYCLGAPLARLEGQIALGTLLRRLPELRLADEAAPLTWTTDLLARGLTRLPVAF